VNAVKTQIWIAVSVYVLVAIVRKRLGLQASLYQITDSERHPFRENAHFTGLQPSDSTENLAEFANQLNLFTL
jgi:hypothetical protein